MKSKVALLTAAEFVSCRFNTVTMQFNQAESSHQGLIWQRWQFVILWPCSLNTRNITNTMVVIVQTYEWLSLFGWKTDSNLTCMQANFRYGLCDRLNRKANANISHSKDGMWEIAIRRVRKRQKGHQMMTGAQHIFPLIPGMLNQFLSRHFNRGCFRITQPLCSDANSQTVHLSTTQETL